MQTHSCMYDIHIYIHIPVRIPMYMCIYTHTCMHTYMHAHMGEATRGPATGAQHMYMHALNIYNDKNYKDALMRFYHSCKWSHPIYIGLDHSGPTNMRIFRSGVKDNDGNIISRGTGGTKKAAEQAAAKKALIHFHQLNQDQILEEDDIMY